LFAVWGVEILIGERCDIKIKVSQLGITNNEVAVDDSAGPRHFIPVKTGEQVSHCTPDRRFRIEAEKIAGCLIDVVNGIPCPGYDDSLPQDIKNLFQKALFLNDFQNDSLNLLGFELVESINQSINDTRIHKYKSERKFQKMIVRQNGTEEEVVILLTTFSDFDSASQFGTRVIESQLAACVNFLPGVTSMYRWNDAIQVDSEVLLILKTTRAASIALERFLQEFHPYEVPEVLLLSPESGSEKYLAWVAAAMNPSETAVDKTGS